ncbi:hypothetical protein QA640_11280 [Bradyrhizobium sp. CB82]|uniref:hypothetical protein n=1 Tax=Bradyrhizobium sp. CB82 TaxID=3039159 RepID=UPI0024B08405|nr:hypothetical protein [Bradyrhizobium sp. CB82]WFU42977.1 hypothetical protein QA640_11280 [Bradyrhizobium sp. CB82]
MGCAGLVTCRLIWMLPAEPALVVIVSRYGIRDLRSGNEFLLRHSIEDVSVRQIRGCKTVLLTSTLRRQVGCVRSRRAISPQSDADVIVIDPAGLATDFATLLRTCQACTTRANGAPHCSRSATTKRKASPSKRHKFAAGGQLCCAAGWAHPR